MGTWAGSAWGDLGSCHPFLHLPATQLLLTIGMRSQTPHLFTFPGGWEWPLPSQAQAALGQGRMVEKSSPQILSLRFPPAVPAPRGDLAVSFSPPSPRLPGSASQGRDEHSHPGYTAGLPLLIPGNIREGRAEMLSSCTLVSGSSSQKGLSHNSQPVLKELGTKAKLGGFSPQNPAPQKPSQPWGASWGPGNSPGHGSSRLVFLYLRDKTDVGHTNQITTDRG